jgi:retron-type reverse transcriptase
MVKIPIPKTSFHELKKFIESKCLSDTKFSIAMVDVDFVKSQLLKFETNAAVGLDYLGAKILGCAAPVIAPHITRIINLSISMSSVPLRWKRTRVTPIFKGGDLTDRSCYRPISVLPLLSKVLERHVSEKLYSYLTVNQLISNNQSGFRKNHSCQSLLIKLTDFLLHNMDQGKFSGLTMLDLRKAFDLVDHSLLLQKLHLYGLDDQALSWFTSYLKDKEFQVKIENELSSKASIKSGVPQGSILGPLLFIIHMNDLPLHLNDTQIDMFADDSTQYVSGRSVQSVQKQLSTEILPIIQWTETNKMVLNEQKTKAMFIASTRKVSEISQDLNITINDFQIETVLDGRLLGVQFDQTLSWSVHIDLLCKKISQRLGILRRIRHHLPLNARKAFYRCLILSLMDYCCVIWGNTSTQNLDRLHRLQKRAARLILDRDHKAPSLELGWLPVHERIRYFRASTVYKVLNNLSPSNITSLLLPFSKVHNVNTRGSTNNNLKLTKVNTNAGKRTFAFLAANEWNLFNN